MLTGCDRRGETMGHFNIKQVFKDPKVRELTLAATIGNVSKVDKLVKEGVDVNAVGEKGVTPLFWITGQPKINYQGMEALLQNGANPNYIPPLKTMTGGFSVMYGLGSADDLQALKLVLQHGGNPNIVDPEDNASGNYQTVLIAAAQRGKIENMKLLLKYGAKIDGTDGTGMTPLLWAVFNRQFKAAYFLLEQGADYRKIAVFPATLDTKTNISNLIGESLRVGLIDEQKPWRKKVIKWLEAHGVPRPKPAAY